MTRVEGQEGAAEPAAPRVSVQVARLPQEGLEIRFKADAEERAALASFLDILSVDQLVATLLVERRSRETVSVRGRLQAEVAQASVVDLKPVSQVIDEPVDLVFLEAGSRAAGRRERTGEELLLDLDEDPPETFSGERIELGAYLREILSLALDPYPRAENHKFEGRDTDPEPDAGKISPFAALAALRQDPTKE